MNENIVKGNWKQFKGKVKEQWGKQTDDDIDVIDGKRDQLLGKLQERHGLAQDEAEKQLSDWETRHNYKWQLRLVYELYIATKELLINSVALFAFYKCIY